MRDTSFALFTLSLLILTIIYRSKHYWHSHFIVEETETDLRNLLHVSKLIHIKFYLRSQICLLLKPVLLTITPYNLIQLLGYLLFNLDTYRSSINIGNAMSL